MARPLIGISTYLEPTRSGVWNTMASFLPEAYYRSVVDAGGTAVLLPPQPDVDGSAQRVIDGLDGLLLAGGSDVDPARYGQVRSDLTDHPRVERDEWELTLARLSLKAGLPTVGICRGHQIMNVALGGTLHQHLPDVIGDTRYSGIGDEFSRNQIALTGGRIRDVYGDHADIEVRSFHHQAVDVVGDGLIVTARGEEGVVQAIEHATHPFYLGVQWHPEQTSADDDSLFRALIDRASRRSVLAQHAAA